MLCFVFDRLWQKDLKVFKNDRYIVLKHGRGFNKAATYISQKYLKLHYYYCYNSCRGHDHEEHIPFSF